MSTEDGATSSSTGYGRAQIDQQRQPAPAHAQQVSDPYHRRHDYPSADVAAARNLRTAQPGHGQLRHRQQQDLRAAEDLVDGDRPASGAATLRPAHHDPFTHASPSKSAAEEQPEALLETVVTVSSRLHAHETQVRPLGVYVRAGRGGPNGVTRVVLVRLTDPADPFFLFELELLEDDYGAFKQRLELLVDFSGFPRYLVAMLRDIAEGASPYELSFVLNGAAGGAAASDAGRGTLRVLEATDFKTVEHISLVLLRQGDAGLKRYLAERFQHFEHAYHAAESARVASTTALQDEVDRLRGANSGLHASLRKAEEEMRFMATDAEKAQLAALNRLRDHHTKEISTARESFDKKVEQLTHAVEEKARQLRETTNEKDAMLTQLRGRVTEVEAAVTSLESQLRTAQDTAAVQDKELAALREMNEELASFKAEATKAMSENELNYVTLAERLRGTGTALQNREEKLTALQAHYERQDEYIRILAEQNKQQADRVREAEKSLDKAHHIIATQLQSIKNVKDRYHIAMDQLRSQEALLQEREGGARRLQDELTAATQRVQELLRKNNELRDQLERTNTAREQLVQEVKLSQQALLRLQQSTSINGRHWGVLSSAFHGRDASAGAAAASATTPATDLMREFAANTHVVAQPGYRAGIGAYHPSSSSGLYRNTSPGRVGGELSSAAGAPQRPSLFAHKTASPSPAHGSEERAGSAETAGLTEPHGRASTESRSRTDPITGAATSTSPPALNPVTGTAPVLDKPSSRTVRSSLTDLAGKSFFPADGVTARATVTTESAYF